MKGLYSGGWLTSILLHTFCFICLLCTSYYRIDAQTIRGSVFENSTHEPIPDATVFIVWKEGSTQLATDAEGSFTFSPEHAGRFDVIVSHLGYELVHLQAMQLSSNKDLIIEVPLTARIKELTEVNLIAPSVRRINNRFFTTTEEETRRFPATFYDPARTAALFPGVYAVNDQANALVINGLPPSLMQWYLEGVPILNPNHLSNAGTLTDRASVNAGGVNMLSNQVLATSSLITGALPAQYGDAVSGVMDIQFRPGNMHKPEHTIQAGLLGLDLASEGKLNRHSSATYLVNYRYSTVGLLSAFGVNFGDEKINFQDLNCNIHFPLPARGAYVRIFGVGGLNKNDLEGPKPAEERIDSRDISDVEYNGGTAIAGATIQYPVQKGLVKATVALSYTGSKRIEQRLGMGEMLIPYSNEDAHQTRLSIRADWQGLQSNRLSLNAGIAVNNHWIDDQGFYPQSGPFSILGRTTLFRPYGQVSYVVTGDVVLRGGLALSMLSGSSEEKEVESTLIPEPSLHVYWQAGEKFSIESGYSYSGITTPQVTWLESSGLNLDLLRTHSFSFIFRDQIRSSTQLAGIIHYYALRHVPAVRGEDENFTYLGDDTYPKWEQYNGEGKGRTISLALAIRQDVFRGSFARAGIGWVKASHKGNAGLLLSTPYDSGPWASLYAGKEWQSESASRVSIVGLNGGVQWRNGIRDQAILLDASQAAGFTVYEAEGDYAIQLEDYLRVDVRVYWRREKSEKTSTWSLDIQNLFGKENAFLHVYDPFLRSIRQTTQLGIIPVLSYRVDF